MLRRTLRGRRGINYQLTTHEGPAGHYSFEIGAPAPSIDAVRQAVQNAVWSQAAGSLLISEGKKSPGHVGEGWTMTVSLNRRGAMPSGPDPIYAGVAEALSELEVVR